ncbi:MAG: hypothetical protein LBT94_02455, partial [Prevotellaceae bacterium]|nr:hypothetical protein [Prevotellaceae bacterium]
MYIIKKQRLSVSPSLRLWLGKHSPVGITLRVYLLSLGVFTLLRLLLFTVYTVGKAAFSAEQAGWGNIFMA